MSWTDFWAACALVLTADISSRAIVRIWRGFRPPPPATLTEAQRELVRVLARQQVYLERAELCRRMARIIRQRGPIGQAAALGLLLEELIGAHE